MEALMADAPQPVSKEEAEAPILQAVPVAPHQQLLQHHQKQPQKGQQSAAEIPILQTHPPSLQSAMAAVMNPMQTQQLAANTESQYQQPTSGYFRSHHKHVAPVSNSLQWQPVRPVAQHSVTSRPPVKYNSEKYLGYYYTDSGNQQYYASKRMDTVPSTDEGTNVNLKKPAIQLDPGSGLEIHSESLIDKLEQQQHQPQGANDLQWGPWASSIYDSINMQQQQQQPVKPSSASMESEDRFLFSNVGRPRPSYPFRPPIFNTSSLQYVDFTLGLADALLQEMGAPTIGRVLDEMDYSRQSLAQDITQVHSFKNFVQHEVNLGYCYAEYVFFDLFKNRHDYGLTFFGPNKRRTNDERWNSDDSLLMGFFRFLGRLRRGDVGNPIVTFLRAALRDIVWGAKKLVGFRDRKKRRRKRQTEIMPAEPAFLNVLKNTLSSVLSERENSRFKRAAILNYADDLLNVIPQDQPIYQVRTMQKSMYPQMSSANFSSIPWPIENSDFDEERSFSSRQGHDHSLEKTITGLSANLEPFAFGPVSRFLDVMLKSNSPTSELYCLKNYVSSKLYYWLGRGLKNFLFS
jgi:hypothetical protein